MGDEWKAADFGRRAYYIEDDGKAFANAKIEVLVRINGKTYAQLHFAEPGLVAIVSKPKEEGIWIERIGPGGVRYMDVRTPEAVKDQSLMPWHKDALGLER